MCFCSSLQKVKVELAVTVVKSLFEPELPEIELLPVDAAVDVPVAVWLDPATLLVDDPEPTLIDLTVSVLSSLLM